MLSTTAGPSTHHDRLQTIREVIETCGMCRASIYAAVSRGNFPRPVKLGRSSRWLASEIQGFISERAAERPREHSSMSVG